MKTTIFELLSMLKDGKPPKKILFRGRQWEYSEAENDYVSIFDEWLFDEYVTTDILNNEVEILETTITYNQEDELCCNCHKEKEKYLGLCEKCFAEDLSKLNNQDKKIQKIDKKDIHYVYSPVDEMCIDKVNEIIDYISKE